jgi:hypothetical protein
MLLILLLLSIVLELLRHSHDFLDYECADTIDFVINRMCLDWVLILSDSLIVLSLLVDKLMR